MAEIVLSAFLTVLFEKLASATFLKLAQTNKINSNLKKWQRLLLQIRDVLNDASYKEIADESVKRWLNGIQHLAYDIDDTLDALATEAMHHEFTKQSGITTNKVKKFVKTCYKSFNHGSSLHRKLDSITTRLQELVDEKDNLGLVVKDGRTKNVNRRLQTSLVDASGIVGREGDKVKLVHKLLEEDLGDKSFSIVPIVGMGGIGKTTLARLLYDEKLVKDHFELKAWVCVSDEFDSFNISKVIYQSVTGENKEFADLNLLQVALRDQIVGKRFLLVLDDVWSESFEDWETLARPFLSVAHGSKIIITTRKLTLLRKLGYNHPHDVQSLSQDDAMFLFAQHSLDVNNFDLHPKLKPHAEGVVKKCDGLPLALRALGRLLRTKIDEEEWKDVLNSEIWRLQEGDGVVPALRLSYHDLPSHLKQLFIYSSLFPKNYLFEKKELILLWMAEGFLHQSKSSSGMLTERLGHEYFEELLSRSFFQRVPNEESMFVMHDLMNDLATFVAGEFFLSLDEHMEKEALEKYRHLSFIREKYVVYQKFEAFQRAKSLRTFLAVSVGVEESWRRFYLSNKILVDLLPKLPLLRVLSLSRFEIFELPDSIGSLKHLRYLNLSCTQITYLPDSVCNLYNLQTLIVFSCRKLSKLPDSFSKLKNLRHFDIRDTPLLNKMPSGIGELRKLQTLSKIIIEGENGFAITDLQDLTNLHGHVYLKGLEKVQNIMHAHQVKLSQKRVTDLQLEWCDVFDNSRKGTLEKEVLNVLKPHNDNLKSLVIVSYGGKEFPNWIGDSSFLWLTRLKILNCKKCTSLPPFGKLSSLKELFIQGMDGVKFLDLEVPGTGVSFPSLEILSFKDMPGWSIWSTNREGVDAVFPCLRGLYIESCPNLVKVSVDELPSLKVLYITSCDHVLLSSIVHAALSLTKLEIRSISGLTDQMWGGILEYLGSVEEISIATCDEIRYLWESEAEASKVLVNLWKLMIRSCENLVKIGKIEEGNCVSSLKSLRMLDIRGCNTLESCICSNSVEVLRIIDCTSVTYVSVPTEGQKLKSAVITNCQEQEFGGKNSNVLINSSIRMLEGVYLCHWPNLKSITELNYLIHLTKLEIINCPSMESFPDHELPNLTLLKYLAIQDCPSMNDSFPRGLWPPKLDYLRIGRLKKPISEWGPQNFPTSLVRLELWGGWLEDVNSCSQLSHLLSSSLTSLFIKEFKKLESLSVGLQHLTSLEHLFIYNCPKIINLPEMLLSSLLSLRIYDCPNLKEKCSRRGAYGPLISYIPCALIDKEY
ncbi:NBS-LRR resistance-like protein [Artemisia annua]|uniref:NBS-LRR resistance-like protein n=1 Tax=Artemisia annua TaxID=35608 RepID=A0A2U1M186_ARTAN|nr:NBS-LRR resistance-like protein [Artemisia annua]